MKIFHVLVGIFILFTSCKSDRKIMHENQTEESKNVQFFPVTDYIKGQIFEIKNGGINPLKIVVSNSRPDSSWLKMAILEDELKDFLSPEIDSTNLTSMFFETRFMDQTLDAITLSYDPRQPLPGSFYLKHWDVYIDPNRERVKRIYLLKNLPDGKTQQLTWTSGKSCNILILKDSSNNKYSVEKNITIQWSF